MKRLLFVMLLAAWSVSGASLSEQEYQSRKADEWLRDQQKQEQQVKDEEYRKRKLAERTESSPVATVIALSIIVVICYRFGKMLWDCGEKKK